MLIGRYYKDCLGRKILLLAWRKGRATYQTPFGITYSAGMEDENSPEGWCLEPDDGWSEVRARAISEGWRWIPLDECANPT